MAFDLTQRIQRLQNYKGSPSPILSIYFKLPIPKRVTNVTIVNKLQSHINANLSIEQREDLKNNIEFIVGFMQNYQQARGDKTLAFFSGGDNLFEVLHLPYEIKTIVRYSHNPYILPIIKAQVDRKRYLVILSDRKKAIFYTIFSGVLEDQKIIVDDTVPQDIQGRWASSQYTQRNDKQQRHIRDHLYQHFEYVAKKAADFAGRKQISAVILGGHKKEMGQFESRLPKYLQEKIIGKFVSDLKTNFNDILARSEEVIRNASKKTNNPQHSVI